MDTTTFFGLIPVIALLVFAIVTMWIVRSQDLGPGKSISEHVAASKHHYAVSALTYTLLTLSLSSYLLFWIAPIYEFPKLFTAITILLGLSGLVLSLSPADSPGSRKRSHVTHVSAAFILLATLVGISIIAATSTDTTTPVTHILAQASLVVYGWLFLLYAFYRPSHKHFVLYESIGFITFFVLLIALGLHL